MKFSVVYMLLILCFNSCSVSSQHTVKTKELLGLSIIDTSLNTILDSVVSFEKNCDYYNDSLFFTVDVRKIKDVYELQIESSNNINNALDYFEPILGYLYYKSHLFIIYNPVSERFFKRTEETKKFKYIKYDKTYQEEDSLTLYHIIDDSFTIWNYWYINGNFVFKGRSSSCD